MTNEYYGQFGLFQQCYYHNLFVEMIESLPCFCIVYKSLTMNIRDNDTHFYFKTRMPIGLD